MEAAVAGEGGGRIRVGRTEQQRAAGRSEGATCQDRVNPEAYLRHVLSVIAEYPVNQVVDLLPWNVTVAPS